MPWRCPDLLTRTEVWSGGPRQPPDRSLGGGALGGRLVALPYGGYDRALSEIAAAVAPGVPPLLLLDQQTGISAGQAVHSCESDACRQPHPKILEATAW